MTRGSYGTSGDIVFGTNGQPLKILEETGEICTVCEDSETGGVAFGIIREGNNTATMVCINCGEQKTVFSSEVIRKTKHSPRADDAADDAKDTK